MVHYLFMIKTSFFIHAFVLATVTLSGEQTGDSHRNKSLLKPLTASLLIHFLKCCFILYTISDKVVYLLCVYSISCQIQLNFDDGHNLHQRRFCPCFL